MAKKNLVFIIEAHQGYLRKSETNCSDENFREQNDILFSAISNTYIPLLDMLERLKKDSLNFKIGLVISAPLCTLLEDPQVQLEYIEHLDSQIQLGEKEILRLKDDPLLVQAKECLSRITQTKTDFTETYGQNLLAAFKKFSDEGYIELIPTAATYAFLPHYADLTEALNAQVETGIFAQRHFFSEGGEGFWLPYMGWSKGIEKILRSYGVNYSIVDTRGILFSEKCPETGIFAPVRTENSLVLFARDPETTEEICGNEGFCNKEQYLCVQNDIGFELSGDELADFKGSNGARIQTGFKYFANGCDEDDRPAYDRDEALRQAKSDAKEFYESKLTKLTEAETLMNGEDPVLVCTIPAEILGQTWFEGIEWFEEVIRLVCENNVIELEQCRNLIENQFSLPKIEPYPCAANGLGYGEDLSDNSNSWMLRHVRKASERMIDLADRFPSESSLKARLLSLGAKEVLLAQSGEWPMMIHESKIPDYTDMLFRNKISSFTKVFDSLASNTVKTDWLTSEEKNTKIFPWMNYRIFCRKK